MSFVSGWKQIKRNKPTTAYEPANQATIHIRYDTIYASRNNRTTSKDNHELLTTKRETNQSPNQLYNTK